jgi:hypothetical protein
MKRYLLILTVVSALTASFVIIRQKALAKDTNLQPVEKMVYMMVIAEVAPTNNQYADQIYPTEIPAGYRDWKLISVAHEAGGLNDLRAILGNDMAVKAFREGKLPFPDGAIIARLAWSYVSSEENNEVFGREQSFIAGPPTNGIQFMIKDSKIYAATGGWGFAQFNSGTLVSKTVLRGCFPCHQAIESRDLVFTRYSP